MNKFLLTLAISLISAQLFPQKAWIEPVEIDPEDSVTIFVDIAQMDCQRLLDTTGPLYMLSLIHI